MVNPNKPQLTLVNTAELGGPLYLQRPESPKHASSPVPRAQLRNADLVNSGIAAPHNPPVLTGTTTIKLRQDCQKLVL